LQVFVAIGKAKCGRIKKWQSTDLADLPDNV